MYQFTRKYNKIILIVVCVFLLPFVGFSFWPLLEQIGVRRHLERPAGSYELPRGVVHELTIGDWEIVKARLHRALATGLLPLRGPLTEDDVWAHITQVEEARLLGLQVSDEQIREYVGAMLRQISQAVGRPQTFADYRRFVERGRMTVKEFEQTLREVLLRMELQRLYGAIQPIAMKELYERFRQEHRRLTLEVVRFDIQAFRRKLRPVDFPLEPRLQAFYKDPKNEADLLSREEFTLPRRFEEVEVLYATFKDYDFDKHKDLLAGIPVTEDELSQTYDKWKDRLFKLPAKKKEASKKEDPKEGTEPSEPEEVRYAPLAEVRSELTQRLLLEKLAGRLLGEVKKALREGSGGKKKADQARPELKALAERFGFRYAKLTRLTDADLEQVKLFGPAAKEIFAPHVREIPEGAVSEAPGETADKVFLVRVVRILPKRLKPLQEVEESLRKFVMAREARAQAEQAARAFYDALEEAVKKSLEPRLKEEVYDPLEKELAAELAREEARRRQEGKPFPEKEKEKIRQRYEELKRARSLPILEEAIRKERGKHFAAVAKAKGLKIFTVSFYPPPRGSFGVDQTIREQERRANPVRAFLEYAPEIRLLREVGQVTAPMVDDDRAAYVARLKAAEPAPWERLDPMTYRQLLQDKRLAYARARQAGVDRLGYQRLEGRLNLKTELRYRPEEPEPTPLTRSEKETPPASPQ